jgi:hypothetical protein
MENLKVQVIELINTTLGSSTRNFDLTGDEFFNSCPVNVPHDSSMVETRVEYKVSKDQLVITSQGEHLGWDDENETFSLSELSLLQLSLILERIW